MYPHVDEDLSDDIIPWEERKVIKTEPFHEKALMALTTNYDRLRKTWLLRALQCSRVRQNLEEVLEMGPSKQRRLLEYLDLIAPAAPLPTDTAALLAALDQAWTAWLQQPPIDRRGRPFNVVAALGEELSLNATEQEIVLFTAMLKGDPLLRQGVDRIGEVNRYETRDVLAMLLDLKPAAIRQALADDSLLLTSGLVELQDSRYETLSGALDTLPQLIRVVLDPYASFDRLFEECLHPAPVPELRPADYAHLRQDFQVITRMLRQAAAQGVGGVNILLHGDPGTGKTQLAHTVAQAAGLTLYQVSANKERNRPHDAEDRLGAYRLAQALLKHRRDCVLLFDEAGDVLKHSREEQHHFGALSKIWLNQTLETNAIPTIWTCNDLYGVDEAFQRRFDLMLELDTPPAAVRQRMLMRHLGGTAIKDTALTRMVKDADLPPGHLQRAAKVLRLLDYQRPARNEQCLGRLLGQRARRFGEEASPDAAAAAPEDFDLNLLQVDVDLPRLVRGLAQRRQGRLCFYGPPGTGKSAFAAWLAQQMDLPLLRKQASDLLGMFVGQTEQQIAAMFQEARERKAVLLIDEADTFLRSRAGAHQRWEVSQVNELLVQMERFAGILICATNLMDELDEAALRRFDLKLCFHPLTAAQAERRFRQLMAEPVVEAELAAALRTLATLDNLTPGDFAVAQRQARLFDQPLTPARLLDVLLAESRAKPGSQRRPIGFVS